MLEIWIDGDACPKAIKEIIYKAAFRTETTVNFVANRFQYIPKSHLIKMIIVKQNIDSVDEFIVDNIKNNDIVITADILFAEAALKQKATVISPKGDLFTENNIGDIVATHNLISQATSSDSSLYRKNPPFSNQDKKAFADKFSRILQCGKKK